jgi:RIO-like serine/threonine protein kinase
MELIKENLEKKRAVYLSNNKYRKVWSDDRAEWIYRHVKILDRIVPGYVLDHGSNYIEYAIVEGTLASTIKHTDLFIQQVYKFCLDNIKSTKPWVHGDWALSNIIIQPNGTMVMIDWDNVGTYREKDYMDKLHSDLISAFGSENFKRAIDDSASV